MEISGWVGSYAVGKSHQSDPEEQGLVDSRITNSGSMAISAAYSWRPSIWSTSVCAATCPILRSGCRTVVNPDRKSTRLNSSHLVISYAVFCLKKKKKI